MVPRKEISLKPTGADEYKAAGTAQRHLVHLHHKLKQVEQTRKVLAAAILRQEASSSLHQDVSCLIRMIQARVANKASTKKAETCSRRCMLTQHLTNRILRHSNHFYKLGSTLSLCCVALKLNALLPVIHTHMEATSGYGLRNAPLKAFKSLVKYCPPSAIVRLLAVHP